MRIATSVACRGMVKSWDEPYRAFNFDEGNG